jgi:hypothetical protein
MNKTRIDQLINILYSLAAVAILLGYVLKIQEFPYGNHLVTGGFIAGALIKLGTIIRSD